MKKIVIINGSARKNGNTSTIINEISRGALELNAEIKTYNLIDMNIRPCHGCFHCRKNEQCYIKDDMEEVLKDIKEANAVIIGSPIYMFQISGQVKLLIDRLYPLLSGEPGEYGLRYGTKKTVTVYSQGSPDIDSFKKYIAYNNKVLGMLGLNVVDTLIGVSANNLRAALENKDLLTKAYTVGKELTIE